MEITIPAEYIVAYPFIGNFAYVQKKDKRQIIDKNNKDRTPYRFYDAFLFTSENNEVTFMISQHPTDFGWIPDRNYMGWGGHFGYRDSKYRLYNLSSDKQILKEIDFLDIVFTIDNYLIVKNSVYEIDATKNVKYINENALELVAGILQSRGISYLEAAGIWGGVDVRRKEDYRIPEQEILDSVQPLLPEGYFATEIREKYFGKSYKQHDILVTVVVNNFNRKDYKSSDDVKFKIFNVTQNKWEIDYLINGEIDYYDTVRVPPILDENIWLISARRWADIYFFYNSKTKTILNENYGLQEQNTFRIYGGYLVFYNSKTIHNAYGLHAQSTVNIYGNDFRK
ncbi:MAG: hypothetical protein LBK13_02530 [Spirochaetales bacterium]|nr:hypothetical protein [Spirochaetales bacterium]